MHASVHDTSITASATAPGRRWRRGSAFVLAAVLGPLAGAAVFSPPALARAATAARPDQRGSSLPLEARAARGAPGALAGQMLEPDAKSSTFAGYSLQGGGEATFTVTASITVPTLTCSTGPEQAIAPSVGVYTSSGSFSAASVFVGCYHGKAYYFPSLVVGGVNHNYAKLHAAAGDKVVLHVSQGASGTVVSVADKSRTGVHKRLHGAGSQTGSAPWVGDSGWDNPALLAVPSFGTVHFSGAMLDGQPFGSAGEALARWDRASGKTTQITTSAFASNHESFTTVFKHS